MNKATYSNKPLTDEELAQKRTIDRARKVAEAEELQSRQKFAAQIKRFGGVIPIRGGRAEEFWKDLGSPERADYEHLLTKAERVIFRAKLKATEDAELKKKRIASERAAANAPTVIRLRGGSSKDSDVEAAAAPKLAASRKSTGKSRLKKPDSKSQKSKSVRRRK